MESIRIQTVIGEDGTLHIDAPSGLPPGPAEVIIVVNSSAGQSGRKVSWHDAYGLGKEIWEGIDAQEYVNELRDEWER